MNITWKITKKRGNWRPSLEYTCTKEDWEVVLAVPCGRGTPITHKKRKEVSVMFFKRKKQHECYFCGPETDGNEQEFNSRSHVCIFCMVKLANVLQYLGISPGALFLGMETRRVQKSRLSEGE